MAERKPMTQHPLADALREGPAPLVRPITLHCEGCKHLRTEWWRDYLDNDETDSGTSARCHAIPHGGKTIGVYWSRRTETPSWCPFRDQALSQYEKSDTDRDKLREAAEECRATAKRLRDCPNCDCSMAYEATLWDQRANRFEDAALASKTAIDPVTVERDKLFEALTPSGDTKAAYLGEFKFNVEIENVDFEEDEDESDHNPRTLMMPVYVPWTTIKDIMKTIRIRALGKDQ